MEFFSRLGLWFFCVGLFGVFASAAMADDDPELDLPPVVGNLLAGPSTQAATRPLLGPETFNQRSIAEFIGHFSGYEPMYFIGGPVNPLAKFELSFKYQVLTPDSPIAKQYPLLTGINLGYSQLCTWALNRIDAPITDTNYKPEFFYSNEDIKAIHIDGVSELGLQTGIGHESNGLGTSVNEHAVNILFFRPIFDFGDPQRFHFYIAPKAYIYIFGVADNPDIARYRGYCDLRAVLGWRQGLEISALGRVGSGYNRGSIQLDVTYPIRDLLGDNVDLYLDAQYFDGYGETLLVYNKRSQAFRIGFALVR